MKKLFDVIKLHKRINSLELELETLKASIGSEAFKKIMNKLDESDTTKRLREENQKLRLEKKETKQENLKLREEIIKLKEGKKSEISKKKKILQ